MTRRDYSSREFRGAVLLAPPTGGAVATVQSADDYAEVRISSADTSNAAVLLQQQGVTRWKVQASATNGDYAIGRYVAGVYQDSPLRIISSTGMVRLASDPVTSMDAATKGYVDSQDGGVLISSSGWNQLSGYANRVTYHGGVFTLEAMIAPTSTKALTAGSLTTVCTLPANTWPVGVRTTGVASYSLTSGAVDAGRLDLNTNGAVSFSPSASGSMTTSGWVGINITYREN